VQYEGPSAKSDFVDGNPAGSQLILKKESVYINLCMTGLKERLVSRRPSGKVLLILVGQASRRNEFQMLDFARKSDTALLCLTRHATTP
jgi:hypothetical protein